MLITVLKKIKNNLFKYYNGVVVLLWVTLIKFKGIVIVGDISKINGIPKIYGKGKIYLGENVHLNSGEKFNPIGGESKLTIFLDNSEIFIGNNTGISNAVIWCSSSIWIGENVKIGGSVKIYDTDFHSLDKIKRRYHDSDIPIRKKICIENDVFIGAHCLILKGVTIKSGSIIGAGSVVTKDIPTEQIWAGNPATFKKNIL